MSIGLLILHVVLGAMITAHGIQKSTHWIGGKGFAGSAKEFAGDGFRGGKVTAVMAGGTQLASGVLLMLGLLTPLAAIGATAVMLIATIVKIPVGFWSQDGGFEYPLFLTLLSIAVAWTGPGVISLDHVLGLTTFIVPIVSAAATVLGVVGALLMRLILHRAPASPALSVGNVSR